MLRLSRNYDYNYRLECVSTRCQWRREEFVAGSLRTIATAMGEIECRFRKPKYRDDYRCNWRSAESA